MYISTASLETKQQKYEQIIDAGNFSFLYKYRCYLVILYTKLSNRMGLESMGHKSEEHLGGGVIKKQGSQIRPPSSETSVRTTPG